MTTASVNIEKLRVLIAGVLEIEPEEVTDQAHFADELEIDSLLMLEISTRVETAFNVPENTVVISGARTLAELHTVIISKRVGETPADPVIRPKPQRNPAVRLFLFHHAGGSHLLYRGWAEHFPRTGNSASWRPPAEATCRHTR